MKPRLISLFALLSVVLLAGCGDNSTSYPIGDGGWQVVLEAAHISNPGDEYPVFVDISAQVINLTDGARPSDGSILEFTTSGGSYENGTPEIEIGTQAGAAETTLQIDHPGRYQISAEYLEESSTATMVITVGI